MSKEKICKNCGQAYDPKSNVCRSCGLKINNSIFKKWWIWLFIIVDVVIIATVCIFSYNASKPLSNGMTQDEGNALLEQGINYYNSGNYEKAIDCFLQLPTDSKQYKKAQELLEKYKSDIITKVNNYRGSGEYKTALKMLENAEKILPDNSDVKDLYQEVYSEYIKTVTENAVSEADELASESDFKGAIEVLTEAKNVIGEEPEVAALIEVYTDDFIEDSINRASTAYKEYDIHALNQSKSILSEAIKFLPDNEALTSELKKYEAKTPYKVNPLTNTDGSFNTLISATDNKGNSYSDVVCAEGFVEYIGGDERSYDGYYYVSRLMNLDFQYSKMTGVLFQNGKYDSASTSTKIIVAEGDYIETAYRLLEKKVTGNSQPVNFIVDVSNQKSVYFYFLCDPSGGEPYHYAYIADWYLWR